RRLRITCVFAFLFPHLASPICYCSIFFRVPLTLYPEIDPLKKSRKSRHSNAKWLHFFVAIQKKKDEPQTDNFATCCKSVIVVWAATYCDRLSLILLLSIHKSLLLRHQHEPNGRAIDPPEE